MKNDNLDKLGFIERYGDKTINNIIGEAKFSNYIEGNGKSKCVCYMSDGYIIRIDTYNDKELVERNRHNICKEDKLIKAFRDYVEYTNRQR